jgi:AraC family transcriptional regulator, transcriptional activator of the genes for pyochelin and ferripyochelin receptors
MVHMKSSIASSRFSWSNYTENNSIAFVYSDQDMPQTPHQIPEEMGKGWSQSIHLPMNMIIRRGIAHFKPEVSGQLFPIATVEEHFNEPVLCIQTARTGRLVLLDHEQGKDFIFGHNNCLFEHINVRNSLVKLDTSENIEMTTLIIGDSVLNQLLGAEHAKLLLTGLRVAAIPTTCVNKIPQYINALLHFSIADHLLGPIDKLHIQAKVLDYLCALCQYFTGTIKTQPPESAIDTQIHQLHDDLLQLDGKVPSLSELSEKYGIPGRKLKERFTNIYGKSLFTYISEMRLNEAHATLLNTEVPMKIIAKNLGYSHVNHFINAFGKQFGYSPGSLRKKNNTSLDYPV